MRIILLSCGRLRVSFGFSDDCHAVLVGGEGDGPAANGGCTAGVEFGHRGAVGKGAGHVDGAPGVGQQPDENRVAVVVADAGMDVDSALPPRADYGVGPAYAAKSVEISTSPTSVLLQNMAQKRNKKGPINNKMNV